MIINTDVVLSVAGLASIAGAVLVPELGEWRRALSPRGIRGAQRHALADLLPYRRLVRPDVIKCASGSYLAAWRIAGADVGTLADAQILNTSYQIAATIGALPPGAIVQFYARRRRLREYDRGKGLDHPVLQLLDELREDFFRRGSHVYHTERTLALTWQPPSTATERLRAAASVGAEAALRTENELLAEFQGLCERVESALSIRTLTIKRLGERIVRDTYGVERRRSDLLAFVDTCVTGTDAPINVPPATSDLNTLLATEVRGGYEVRIGELEVGAIELKAYPDHAVPRMLDRLTELKLAHLLQIRFMPMPVSEARQKLRDAAVDFRGAAHFNAGYGLVDPDALAASQQMLTAFGKAGGDYTRFGRVNVVLIIRAKTRDAVAKGQRAVIAILEDAGFRATIRRMGALDTILSTMPAQTKYGIRKHPLDALTVSKLFPVHEADLGRRYSESEALPKNVPATTYALGPGETMFRMHLNVRDVWNGFTLGSTGVGKSVQANFIVAMYRGRLPFAGVTTIDRGRSSYQITKMLDGEFYDLLGRRSPGFALFSDCEDPEQARDVLRILEEMLTLSGVAVTPERYEHLKDAVRVMASRPPQARSLFLFLEQLQDPDRTMRPALRRYTRLGELGTMLDCSEDNFVSGRFNAIDVERVVGMSAEYLVPIYRTMLWKTTTQIRRMKERMGHAGEQLHWMINIDEAHTLMRDAIGGRFILDTLKTGRKENIAIWLSSNSAADFAKFEHRNDLLSQTATRIFFGDAGAISEDEKTIQLYEDLQLPARGIALLPILPDRSFVLHQPDAAILRELNLRLDKEILAVIGTSRTIGRVDEFMDRYPADRWKIELLRASGATAAANRLEAILHKRHADRDEDAAALLTASG